MTHFSLNIKDTFIIQLKNVRQNVKINLSQQGTKKQKKLPAASRANNNDKS